MNKMNSGISTTLIGRKEPQKELLSALHSNESEFIAIYGRRRIGKTFLVKKVFENAFAFSYTGVEEYNTRQQLGEFYRSMLSQGLHKCAKPQNWFDAFSLLKKLLETKSIEAKQSDKKIVFLDELPWMDAKGSDFLKALGHFWNDWAAWTNDIVLVVCGSATSWMINKVFRNHGGLYNRVTRQIELAPFSLHECEEFCELNNFGWSRYMITEAYMILGGVPHYWKMIDPSQSLYVNIDRMFFSERAPMKMEYRALFSSMFSFPERYETVINALVHKKKGLTAKEISECSGIGMSASLTTILENLSMCGFIRQISQPTKQKRGAIYQLIDNYTLFYHEYILNRKEQSNYWTINHNSGEHQAWRGIAFERVCMQHLSQIQKALGISGVYCKQFSWNAPKTDEYPGMQIDMVIDRADNMVNLCEIKFTDEAFAITPEYMHRLRLRRGRYQQEIAPKKGIHLTMITSAGVVQNPQKLEINSFVILDDLFAE
mgnify:CR=1 FL=1